MTIKTAFFCSLLLLGAPTPSEGWTERWVEDEVCNVVVSVMQWAGNHYVCGAAEAAAVAAVDGASGGAAIPTDGVIYEAVGNLCGWALKSLENHEIESPDEFCSHNGFRRRRTDGTRPESQIFANWTAAHTAGWLQIRSNTMNAAGTPMAIFPNGKLGYCFQHNDTGAYICHENAGDDTLGARAATRSVAGQAQATRMSELQVTSSSTGPISSSGSLTIILILAVALVLCVAYSVQLNQKVGKLQKAAGNPDRLLGADETELTEYAAASSA